MENKIEREKEYHNKRFAEEVRTSVQKFYSIEAESRERFQTLIKTGLAGQKVLELGCGKGSYAFEIAKAGGFVHGIDISDVAIEYSKKKALELNISDSTDFQVMNAEELKFAAEEFQLLFGSSILHHLDLGKAIPELSRVLRKDGKAIFIEPLGHNIFINLYRKYTPNYRTEDEHPFVVNDFEIIRKFFGKVEIDYFHLSTLFAVPFRKLKSFGLILSLLQKFDRILFKTVPFLRRQAWQIVIVASEPKRRT